MSTRSPKRREVFREDNEEEASLVAILTQYPTHIYRGKSPSGRPVDAFLE